METVRSSPGPVGVAGWDVMGIEIAPGWIIAWDTELAQCHLQQRSNQMQYNSQTCNNFRFALHKPILVYDYVNQN